jgi:large subunit ribosomal protein L23
MAKEIHLYDVLVRPISTEKTSLNSADHNHYTFEVNPKANKIQIKEAVEVIFDVDVLSVNTLVMPAKRGRRGRRIYVRKGTWKKAVVKLATGQRIEFLES